MTHVPGFVNIIVKNVLVKVVSREERRQALVPTVTRKVVST